MYVLYVLTVQPRSARCACDCASDVFVLICIFFVFAQQDTGVVFVSYRAKKYSLRLQDGIRCPLRCTQLQCARLVRKDGRGLPGGALSWSTQFPMLICGQWLEDVLLPMANMVPRSSKK